jgi:hypothetical protein
MWLRAYQARLLVAAGLQACFRRSLKWNQQNAPTRPATMPDAV